MKRPTLLLMLVILASIFLFFLLNLLLGSVHIPFRSVWNILWGNTDESIIWQNIIWKSRVPQALTALVAGAGLSVSGLQMQTVFRNPLAGPSVLGISSGASLGVACVVLLSGAMGGVALSKLGYMGEVALSIAAIIGALSVMALIVYVSQKVKGNVTLLIIGVMIGYVASAIIGVWICPEPGAEHQACTPVGDLLFRCIGGDCDGILRSDYVYRSGCSPSLSGYISYIRPSDTDACHITGRGFVGVGVQPHSTYAGI